MRIKEGSIKDIMYLYNSQDFKTGWYFSDECEQVHGPFLTEDDAETAYADHCANL